MKKGRMIVLCVVFFSMLYGISILGLVQQKKTYSSTEKRMLQTFPKLSAKRVLKGKFQKKYETYLSDQFPARDQWIQVKSITERLIGKTESNQVFFGKKHYLLEKYTEKDFNKKQIKKNIQALKKLIEGLIEENINIKVLMVPSKTEVLKDYLPLFAESYNETIFFEMLTKELPEQVLVPIKEILEAHKEEYIYYRNDHHWTGLGAWYGYQAYMDMAYSELEPKWQELIEKKKQALKSVSKNFLGTTYSKVNMYSEMDEIFVYEPKGEFSVIYNQGEKIEDTFYQWEYLEKQDQYSVFSGGNQGILEITGGKKNGRTLMLVKDSFANCMVPFLMEDYEKLVVVDMRQINVGLSMVMRMYKPSDVLVLYNMVQFMQDTDFAMKP